MKVVLLNSSPRPNLVCYHAMHQCYSCDAVVRERALYEHLSEKVLGNRLVKRCVTHGHWSVLEHAHFVFNAVNYPHDVVVQARTHRILSFSVQSQRYTYEKVYNLGKLVAERRPSKPELLLNDTFYFRNPGEKYIDREGNKYTYTDADHLEDVDDTLEACVKFAERIDKGYAPEHARMQLPQNFRQNFVVSGNARALLHFCDLRLPKDAQTEIRDFAEKLFLIYETQMPEVAEWYRKNRYGRNKLSP